MQGRIIAIRVSDADFAKLEELKQGKGIGWNQLLLEPAETAYGLTLESARPAKKKAEPAEGEGKPAETGKKKRGRGRRAETPVTEEVEETETETEG